MAPKKFPNLELRIPSKIQAWLNAKDANFANTVGLGQFYTDEWRFVPAPLVREWLKNLPATGYTSSVRGRLVTLNRASIDQIFGFPDVLPDIHRRNPNSDEHRILIGIIAGPDAKYREKQGYTVSKFNTEINKIRVKGILQTLLMLKKVDAAPLFLIENLAKALNSHAIAWGDIFFKAVTNDVDKIRKGTTPHTCVGGVITLLIRQQLGPWSLADTKEMGRWINPMTRKTTEHLHLVPYLPQDRFPDSSGLRPTNLMASNPKFRPQPGHRRSGRTYRTQPSPPSMTELRRHPNMRWRASLQNPRLPHGFRRKGSVRRAPVQQC